MTKKLDPDIRGLKMGVKAMEISTPRMRKATLEFLWDKYVTHAKNREERR